MSRLACLGLLIVVTNPLTAWCKETIYISTVSNSGIITLDAVSHSVFAPLPGCSDMVFDGGGNLYTVRNNSLLRIDPDGNSSVFADGILTNSYGLALDGSGNLYVANRTNDTIQMSDPSGTVSVFSTASELDGPFDLAFDSRGNLYASNIDDNNILVFNSGGQVSVFASGLNAPTIGRMIRGVRWCVWTRRTGS